ncbi:MAG: metal-dependent hydrolase [Nanoarchaeota archaeon]|nr:metal-dependent hydrolase [Nanoarchaeota archaeon]
MEEWFLNVIDQFLETFIFHGPKKKNMPLAVTHILLSVIIVDLYRDYITKHKRFFSLHTVFLAGFFGILPDIDIVFNMLGRIFDFTVPVVLGHGGITHTPFFAGLFLIPGYILWKKKRHKQAVYFFVGCFAILFHIMLDYFIGGGQYEGIMWLFPFTVQSWKLHLITYMNMPNIPEALDALILLAWLWHEEVKHKITDFI